MGKEGDLWDDSALINAFDDAISKYKIMHSKEGREGSNGKAVSCTEENLSAIDEERSDAERPMQGKNNDVASTKENNSTDTHAPEHHISSSNGQDLPNENSNTQGEDIYNCLLSQYYELEERRQKILQQLYQFTGSNLQDPGYENQVPAAQVVPWGTTTSASYENHLQAATCPAVGSCYPFACPCLAGTCASLPACCVGMCESETCEGTLVNCHNRKSTSLREGDLINTALGAAERALSSLKINDSGISEGPESSSETDLSVVLNAWYSAGFYTGKYVSEQSLAKR